MNPFIRASCLRLSFALSLLSFILPCPARADSAGDEASQISVLQSQSSPREKDAACAWLKRQGTAASVPALAALLNDEQLSQSARYALESIPGPEAGDALIAALAQTSGLLKAAVVNSLGVRREARAVPELAKLLTDPDLPVARATAAALGDIASPAALKALQDRLQAAGGSAPNAILDGCLRCAQRLLKNGDARQAYAVYQEIFQGPFPVFFHVAAFRGLVLADDSRAVGLLAGAITNGPAPLQMEAIQLVHEKAVGATKPIAELLPNVDALAQTALIDALNQRDDPAAVPEIEAVAKHANSPARVAALGALGSLGDDHDVPLLLEAAAAPGDAAQPAARQALVLLHRGNPNRALVDLLPGAKPEAQAEIIRTLNNRTAVEAVPQLMQLARQADDPVREAALQALARLVDQQQLDPLVQMVGQLASDTGRAAAAEAVGLACRHIQRRTGTVDMAPVWAALKSGSTETRVALLPVCSGLTDPTAREILRAGITDSQPDVRAAAVRALCGTMDAALVPDVEALACKTSDADARLLAIEACVRLTTQEDSITIPDPERIKLFQAIMPVAATAPEKRVVLSGLAALSADAALQLAEPLVSDVTVSNEAARAVTLICRKLGDPEEAVAALKNLLPRISDDAIRREAEAALSLISARAEFLTTWQFAGPYRQTGQNFRKLFDIVFPPETAEAKGVMWRDLAVSDDPKTPGAMDLLKAIGGEQVVAYARTSIHSAAEQSAWLLINSDDGVKAWLNGEVVHANNVSRALTGPPDKVRITLKPGWNDLLLKVTQNNMGWGFCVRVTNPDGSRLTGLQYAADPGRRPL